MSGTEKLRELLDERGVEYDGKTYEGVTFWNDDTNMAVASENYDGKLWVSQSLTPAQAVEATLGSDLKAENEQLRRERDFYFQQVTDNGERAHGTIDALNADNAKLRELCGELYHELYAAIDKYWPASCLGELEPRDVFPRYDELIELGVEV